MSHTFHESRYSPSYNYELGCRCPTCSGWKARVQRSGYRRRQAKYESRPEIHHDPSSVITFANGPLRGWAPTAEAHLGLVTQDGHRYGSVGQGDGGRVNYIYIGEVAS